MSRSRSRQQDEGPLVVPTGPQVKIKIKRMMDNRDTMIWLLATAAEADQIQHGLVPEDIREQATVALHYVHDHVEGAGASNGSRLKKRKEA